MDVGTAGPFWTAGRNQGVVGPSPPQNAPGVQWAATAISSPCTDNSFRKPVALISGTTVYLELMLNF